MKPILEVLEARTTPSYTWGPPLVPGQVQAAYGEPANGGKGETIAIVVAGAIPTAASDLATFDAMYNQKVANLQVIDLTNGSGVQSTWPVEANLDLQWAHVTAPRANLVLVEAASSFTWDLFPAVQVAAEHANVVSMSWGGNGDSSLDLLFGQYLQQKHVTYVAADGDTPTFNYPAMSHYVLAVSATQLNGARNSLWAESGRGGFVAMVGATETPVVEVLDGKVIRVAGTSASAPQFAGMLADVEAAGGFRWDTKEARAWLSHHARDFNHVSGVTLGSPIGARLLSDARLHRP